ncbi:glyoxalase [Pedobacter sp. Leaf41]|uniref:VOC family protein n=1 Tax=Pedobacter sp. Leaf41 TaxID=1736218 RepID=UPI000703BC52|nr:glyoxalase/bleomycin resistance/dioxygenase family protein [Pedobacter sp. Leaf41]KQN35036.1 glyoxalase [Pedobacter sp. Leaf41]RZK67924.1 MAG: VOC family protein [Pedobacter sp.]
MLQTSKTFSSFSVKNIEEAKAFYELIGLKTKVGEMGILGLELEGNENIMLYPKDNHEPATFTVLNFPVNNIDEAVDDLIAKGIKFEQYDSEYLKTDEKGISRGEQGPKIAWFKDPSGNILSVLEG